MKRRSAVAHNQITTQQILVEVYTVRGGGWITQVTGQDRNLLVWTAAKISP
jgi:hypothetical protein